MPYTTAGRESSGTVELYDEDHGTGTPVVLIHGHPLDGRSWEKQTSVVSTGNRLPGLISDLLHTSIAGGPHAVVRTHAGEVDEALLAYLP